MQHRVLLIHWKAAEMVCDAPCQKVLEQPGLEILVRCRWNCFLIRWPILQSFLAALRPDLNPRTAAALQMIDGGSDPQGPQYASLEAVSLIVHAVWSNIFNCYWTEFGPPVHCRCCTGCSRYLRIRWP